MSGKVSEDKNGAPDWEANLAKTEKQFLDSKRPTTEDHAVRVGLPDKNRRFEVCDEALS